MIKGFLKAIALSAIATPLASVGAWAQAAPLAEITLTAQQMPNVIKHSDAYSSVMVSSSVMLKGFYQAPDAHGTLNNSVTIQMPPQFEQLASGNIVEIEVSAWTPRPANFQMAYSTNDVGNSGWVTLRTGRNVKPSVFQYKVPELKNGNLDFVGILPDPNNTGQFLTIESIKFTILPQ